MRMTILVFVCLFGFGMKGYQPGPKKGKCPFREGIMRKMTTRTAILGTTESTVDIYGKDSVVLSAVDGRVMQIYPFDGHGVIEIRKDTTVYTYWHLDRSFVKEGQMVIAGQPIAAAKDSVIGFFVSNNFHKIFRDPDAHVDCVCELAKP